MRSHLVALALGLGASVAWAAKPALPMPPGIDESAMNPSIDPCDDFYQYACGGWLAHAEIPPDRSRWSRGFVSIQERNEKILRDILEAIAKGAPPGGTAYGPKLADFWSTCMDEPKLESASTALKAELAKLAHVSTAADVTAAVSRLHAEGMSPLFDYDSQQDFKDATQMIAAVDEGGLGLPDRDYYVKEEPKMKEVRALYLAHVARMLELAGDAPAAAKKKADEIMAFETELAKASYTRAERRDPLKVYHRIDRPGLEKAAPDFGWEAFLKEVGTPDVQKINVTHPEFFEALDALLKKTPPAQWRPYLEWVFIRSVVPALPKRFQDEDFQFSSKALTGAKEDKARWKKCVAFTDQKIGMALAQPFVAAHFGPEGKAITTLMVQEIEKVFEKNLQTLSWMDAPTQAKALEKVRAIVNQIGYPEKWRNYDALVTDKSSFLSNLRAADAFEMRRRLAKIGKPVDRTEWSMTPPTVNAYYTALFNEIVFPAGILQPPFFDKSANYAVNFGSMGMVVGHETTHGFDDQGRHFDSLGNLKDWWTDASAKAFIERTDCVKKQFDGEVAIDDLHVNGALTLGENVADLGGLKFAHAAMESYLKANPGAVGAPARFTREQQLFLGYAQSWCTKSRPEDARMRVTTDPHSPPFLRVNVPLSNLPEFQTAFQCKPGSKMVRAQRCAVW